MAFTKNKPAAVSGTTVASETPVVVTPVADAPAAAESTKAASGTGAAISRLKKADSVSVAKTSYQGRDFDKEARGKTRCVQFEAALMSPALAGMPFDTPEQFLELCRKAADYGTAYTFGDELPK